MFTFFWDCSWLRWWKWSYSCRKICFVIWLLLQTVTSVASALKHFWGEYGGSGCKWNRSFGKFYWADPLVESRVSEKATWLQNSYSMRSPGWLDPVLTPDMVNSLCLKAYTTVIETLCNFIQDQSLHSKYIYINN